MNKRISLSVHQLVDFLLRQGDIDNRIYNKNTMQEGTKIHSLYQSRQNKENYISEHYLKETFAVDDFKVSIDGRADGIILGELNIIDEIKSTIDDLNDFHNKQESWHLGQAKCYALMFAHEQNLSKIGVRLTYISQINNEKIIFNYYYSVEELEEFVIDLIKRYLEFYKFIYERTQKRNKSCEKLEFPYAKFRENQKIFAKYAYGIAKNGGILFCEAPTGTGKTISTIYPFTKSFMLGKNDKIFYLTAKNSGKESALKAVEDLKNNGLFANVILITAKEKICLSEGCNCNPDECPFAKDYYSKIQPIIINSIKNYDKFDISLINQIALENRICPFEFQLDLSLWCDIIICDYNYLFDPISHMQRFFDEDCSKYLVLVDEAHNLVDRSKDMYSCYFDTAHFKILKNELKFLENKKFTNSAKKLTTLLNNYKKEYEIGCFQVNYDDELFKQLSNVAKALQDISKKFPRAVNKEFREFSRDVNKIIKLSEYFDDNFIFYIEKYDNTDFKYHLMCLDASSLINKTLSTIKGKILFSATLSPIQYHIDMLGGTKNDPILTLNSPFDPQNLKVIVNPTISTRYKKRGDTYGKVSNLLKTFINSKLGNYLIYLPSFEYLVNIIPFLDFENVDLIIQDKEMNDEDKSRFLSNFVENPSKTTVGIVILGGSFSEGIDLVKDRLIGVAVVGVGLPQICFEKNVVKEHFNNRNHDGFEYSYINPGINKVTQAIGRVIRTEEDMGVALLIDDRYLSNPYRSLLDNKFKNYQVSTSSKDLKEILDEFWIN